MMRTTMSNENNSNSGRESPKEMLRDLFREELRSQRKKSFVANLLTHALPLLAAGGILFVAWFPQKQQTPEPASVFSGNKAENLHSLEKIVGITTALMVMADQQHTTPEMAYALDIISKRQDKQIGAPLSFIAQGNSQWLNREASLSYFHNALAYLKGHENQLAMLRGDSDYSAASVSSAVYLTDMPLVLQYNMIAIIQDAINNTGTKDDSIYHEIKSLTRLWTDIKMPGINDGEQSTIAAYQSQADRLLKNLNIDVRTP